MFQRCNFVIIAVFMEDYCAEIFPKALVGFQKFSAETFGMFCLCSHDRFTLCFGTMPLKNILLNNL